MKKNLLFLIIILVVFSFLGAEDAKADTATLRPNAPGDYTNLGQVPTSGANWDKVDDVTPDGNATYVWGEGYPSYTDRDLYNLSNHTTGTGTINFVKVYIRCLVTATSEYSVVRPEIKTGGTMYQGDNNVPTTSYTTYSHQWGTNPKTGSAWTWAEIDELQAGFFLYDDTWPDPNGEQSRATQLYVEVDYTLPGTETLRPSANYAVQNYQYPSSGSNYDKVDDVAANGFTNYVYNTATSYQSDLYNLPAHSGSGTINFIKVYFLACTWTSPAGYGRPVLRTHSTIYYGTPVSLSTTGFTPGTFTKYSQQWSTNPYTGSAWTWTEIDALQIGISLKTGLTGDNVYCTQVYVVVDYTPAAACTVNCNLDNCPNTLGITTGCDLLLYYDTNDDGIIDINENLTAINDYFDGLIANAEVDFVNDCYTAGGINIFCSGCYVIINNPPTITSVTDSPDPVTAGNSITFTANWSDPDSGDQTKLHICKTNSISGQTCSGGYWCNTASWDTTSPSSCSYTTNSGDVGSHSYYAFICDDDNACSSSKSGSFTVEEAISPPSVTTEIATVYVQNNKATLNGNIADTGGENCDERGFEWGTSPGSYPNNWTETGSYATGAFSHQITGLNPGTIYYFRAKAHNSAGWGYGGERQLVIYTASGGQKQFTTLPITYTLTVFKAGTGTGIVTDTDLNCGADCSEDYPSGTSVILTATPDSGSEFAGWSGDCSGTGACNLTMDSDKNVTATFNVEVVDNPPEISISCLECAEIKNIGDVVSVTVSATDDFGLNQLYFVVGGDREGSGLPNPWEDYFSCNGAISCSHTWNITLDAFGPNLANWDWTFWGNTEDTVGQWGDYAGTGVKDIFDFNLSVSPNSGSVIQGESNLTTVTANLVSPATRSVSFSASGLPPGASVSFSPTSCNPTCDSTMTITTSVTTPTGTYSITIKGENGNLVRTTTYNLTVTTADTTPPTTQIKVIRTSTGEDVTAAENWLRADTYTIKFEDNDPEPNSSGLKNCEYYVYDTQASTFVVLPTPRTCGSWSLNITAGTPLYHKEGPGAYLIYSYVIDNADLWDEAQIGLNFDFTPPETWIE